MTIIPPIDPTPKCRNPPFPTFSFRAANTGAGAAVLKHDGPAAGKHPK